MRNAHEILADLKKNLRELETKLYQVAFLVDCDNRDFAKIIYDIRQVVGSSDDASTGER